MSEIGSGEEQEEKGEDYCIVRSAYCVFHGRFTHYVQIEDAALVVRI